MNNPKFKKILTVILLAGSLLLILAQCNNMVVKRIHFSFRSLDDFISLKIDSRILYEPRAKIFAQQVAQLLPEAIAYVEKGHYRSFIKPIKIYIFATESDYSKITGFKAPAHSRPRGVCFSPKIFKENRPMLSYLTHELSHLHLLQQLGEYKCLKNIPTWFFEGLATFVSNGGGAHLVTKEKAIESIKRGNHFVPHAKGSFIFPKYGNSWGLKPHMFYRQSMIFVAYLKMIDEKKYQDFLLKIQDRASFADSFNSVFEVGLNDTWINFLKEIKL